MLLNNLKLDRKMKVQLKEILSIKDKIESSQDISEIQALTKIGLNYLKDWVYDYYNSQNNVIHPDYNILLKVMQDVIYPNVYLVPINLYNYFKENEDYETNLLNNITNKVRSELMMNECLNARPLSFADIDFSKLENDIKAKVIGILHYLHIDYQILKINPGFLDTNILNPQILTHYAFILNFKTNKYILDIAYPRYFCLKNNIVDALGVVGYDSVNVGFYMTNNPQRKELAISLLNNGYVKITEENLKYYGDGLALSFRNGLYYDNLKELNFKTHYTAQNYLKFFNGEDNQVNYEGVNVLGRQRVPVNNKDLFKF